ARYAAAVALLAVGSVLFWRRPIGRDTPSRGSARSIAVLPFANLSGDRNDEYFSDGMSEELITALHAVPGLRVAARTSAFAFRAGPAVPECRLLRAGGAGRLSVRLLLLRLERCFQRPGDLGLRRPTRRLLPGEGGRAAGPAARQHTRRSAHLARDHQSVLRLELARCRTGAGSSHRPRPAVRPGAPVPGVALDHRGKRR